MNYKSYPKKADTPSRTARKHARGSTFLANKKAARLARKARRNAIVENENRRVESSES